MATITASTTIDATPERVWEVLSDFGGIFRAAPHLKASILTNEQATGVGAARHCDLSMPGVSTEEVVTRWDEGRGYGVDVRMKGMPVRDTHADFDIDHVDGRTVLTGVMRYEMPFGPLGRLMDRLAARRMASLWAGMLAGLKARAESGAEVGTGTELPLEAVRVT